MGLFAYLSLYSWNQRTGHLDQLAANSGMEMATWVLAPGKWVKARAMNFWERYMDLVNVKEQNEQLQIALDLQSMELAKYREEAAEAFRLREILSLAPPEGWPMMGARIIANRLGPAAALETILLDKGAASGVHVGSPVLTPAGVVGRVIKHSPHASQVLLITDGNSRLAVVGQKSRTSGIVVGRGAGEALEVLYVPQNAELEKGEILVTSGIAGIFPKGLPVARVLSVTRSDLSLFQEVIAISLVDLRHLEEVLILTRPGSDPKDDPAWSER